MAAGTPQITVPNTASAVALDWYKDSNHDFTPLGQKVHDLKYGTAYSYDAAATVLANDVAARLGGMQFGAVIPVPSHNARTSTNPNGVRKVPYAVGEGLAKLKGVPFMDVLSKTSDRSSKDGALTADAFICRPGALPSSVLLIDDLYGSGASAALAAQKIKAASPATQVHFVTLTKNMHGGLGKRVEAQCLRPIVRKTKKGTNYLVLSFTDGSQKQYVCLFDNHRAYETVRAQLVLNPAGAVMCTVRRPENVDGASYWQFVDVASSVE